MLKHRINIKEVKDDTVELTVSEINITDIIVDNDLLSSKKVVVCTYDNNVNMKNVIEVFGTNTYQLLYNDGIDATPSLLPNYEEKVITNRYDVSNTINLVNGTFGFEIPFLHSFIIQDISYNENSDGDDYIYVSFTQPHYFTAVKPITGEDNSDTDLFLYGYENEYENNKYYLIGTEEEFDDYEDIFTKICKIDIWTGKSIRFITNETLKNEFFLLDENNEIVRYNPIIRFYRQNFLFTDWGIYNFFYYDYKCKVQVPLSSPQMINLNKETILNEYIEDARERSINKTIDMEKDIYYPVIYHCDTKTYENVYKLKFNFHFIFRDNENWTAETGNMWNGVEINEENDDLFKLNGVDGSKSQFFSYKEPSEQSDLLSLLNFTNNDVRYQKNKLKKSFIRLTFYDSPNPSNQNLLFYSTIFMNGGEYFNKYIKYIETEGYRSVLCKTDIDEEGLPIVINDEWNQNNFIINDDLTGIRVDREPDAQDDEEKRLSSQIIVTDKYNSDASSEGFYLYLWRDLLPIDELGKKGVQTIYMKVEFNHAGYGRIIPFMMPYWDKNKWNSENNKTNKIGIKKFNEIIDDWNEKDHTDGQYGARQYSKFSYIKLKIGYDETQRKYIYYLDDETYGQVDFNEENVLTFNLYEAKMV